MADKLINARIPVEMYEAMHAVATHNGITLSEFIRACLDAGLRGVPGDLRFTDADGYRAARSLATKLAHEMLDIAKAQMPESYEEAAARYGFTPHAPEHDGWKETRDRLNGR